MISPFVLVGKATQNFLLEAIPESLGLLLFGVFLILLTVGLRWLLSRSREISSEKMKEVSGKFPR
jgi:hypothetical protein